MNPIKNSLAWITFAPIPIAILITLAACKSSAPSSEPQASAPAPTAATAIPVAATPRVEVTSNGFQPSRVVLGTSRQVTFRRTSDRTCATTVVFPDLHIEKALPLNTDVTIDLPASANGELGFQCGMGMYKSKVVVQ